MINRFWRVPCWLALSLAILSSGCRSASEKEAGKGPSAEMLFTATPLTADGLFTKGIEGPACDREGNIYAVNFGREHTIGRVSPEGKAELFVTLPGKSTGNGIVIDRKGTMFVADYVGHNVLKINPQTRSISVFAHEDSMNQPNDLAIAADGTLYASDPNWKNDSGQLWRIDQKGEGDTARIGPRHQQWDRSEPGRAHPLPE